jgi:hypothetical protein
MQECCAKFERIKTYHWLYDQAEGLTVNVEVDRGVSTSILHVRKGRGTWVGGKSFSDKYSLIVGPVIDREERERDAVVSDGEREFLFRVRAGTDGDLRSRHGRDGSGQSDEDCSVHLS